jgi:hypothetical protein
MFGENETTQADTRAVEKKDKVFKIDMETDDAEFVSFCEANDIDCDMDGMTDDERKDFEPIKKRFIKACMQGRVTVDGRTLKYTNSEFTEKVFQEEVTISRPSVHAFMAMDGYKETQGVHKLQGFVSSMTGKEVKYFSKIDSGDWLFYRDMAVLFLAG